MRLRGFLIIGLGMPVRLLVEAGADVSLADGDDVGATPLRHARERGYTEIAGILRSAGGKD